MSSKRTQLQEDRHFRVIRLFLDNLEVSQASWTTLSVSVSAARIMC